MVGYALLRCAEIQGVRAGLIMDLLVEPTPRGEEAGLLLLETATRRFREAGMWMAASLMLGHTQECALLRRAGYVPCPRWLAPRPFCWLSGDAQPRLLSGRWRARSIAGLSLWPITMGASGSVRCDALALHGTPPRRELRAFRTEN